MDRAFQFVSIVMSIALIALILLQVKGGGLGSLMGGESGGGITRTRRGLEKTLFQITVGFCIAFLGVAILSAILSS